MVRRLFCAALTVSLLASHGVAAAVAYVCAMDGMVHASCCCSDQDEITADEVSGDGTGMSVFDNLDSALVADASDCCEVKAALREIAPSLFIALPKVWPPHVGFEVALAEVPPLQAPSTLADGQAFIARGAAPIFVRLRTLLL